MEFSDADIQAFIEAWEKDFGETLTPSDATHHATRLMQFALLAARPLPDDDEPNQNEAK